MSASEANAEPQSPLATAIDELLRLGFHPVPALPPTAAGEGRGKAPGEFRGGRWWGMKEWQRFRDRPPSEFELRLWRANWPEANVGVVLGSPAAGMKLLAVDVDTTDADEFDEILRALPQSPMTKKGAKGLTLFYRAPAEIKSKGYKVADRTASGTPLKRTLVDLLTGSQTRQTIVPPSVHPDGPVYAWTAGPVPAADLPIFDDDALTRLEEALEGLGWGAEDESAALNKPEPRASNETQDDTPTVWRDLNDEALANLDKWVAELDLHNLRTARGGYEAVATWRHSSTGQALERRKRNLKIHPTGIRDMGDDRTYTALDLIQAAQGCELDAAFGWLSARLGHAPAAVALQPARVVETAAEAAQANGSAVEEAKRRKISAELPDHLTRPGGLVEEITDWICATSRQPSRVLALGAALVIVGTVCGRQFAGPTRTGTHLYILSLAPTASGKDPPLQAVARCMTQANLRQHLGPNEFTSMPAAIKFLTRAPLAVCPMDEFGSFMKRINSRRASGFESAITGVLRTAWGRSFATMTTPEWAQVETRTIHAPALSLLCASTPEEFYGSLAVGDATNGVLNRFLVLGTHKRIATRKPVEDPGVVPPAILERLRGLYYAKGELYAASLTSCDADCQPDVRPWGPGAETVFDNLDEEINRRSDADSVAAAFFGRTVEMAQRIATIVALGRDGAHAEVTERDMTFGRDLALWSAEAMLAGAQEHMAENEHEMRLNRVRKIIREEGLVTKSKLLKRSKLMANDLDQVVKTLVATGEICAPTPTAQLGRNGPAPTEYRWVGD
jgi:hypothetical protein